MPVKYDQDTRAKAIRLVRDGSLKMWEHLRWQGITAARCTVERLIAFWTNAVSLLREHSHPAIRPA